MKQTKHILPALLSTAAMLAMILDSKTAAEGAAEGIWLCIRTVIPALFPLMVLSTILTSSLYGQKLALLRPLGKVCGIPDGAESLLITALVGGYPVGAKCVSQAYQENVLTKQETRRMLSFCSNAGPAFIFGICGGLFCDPVCCWILWGIHILSALAVGALTGKKSTRTVSIEDKTAMSLPSALLSSVKTMGTVCGWVILFRVLLRFLQAWVLWLLPKTCMIFICGFFELTNGCCQLADIPNEAIRFVLCSVFLSFGGLCVVMQTASVTQELGIRTYIQGKGIQALISLLLSAGAANLFWKKSLPVFAWCIPATLLLLPLLYSMLQKKSSFFRRLRI